MKHKFVVMVVDHGEVYEFMRPTLRELLKPDEVIHCHSVEQAAQAVREHEKLDLIFTDWDIAGGPFIRALRSDYAHHLTPVVVMSSDDSDEFIAQAMRAGATDFLIKPFLEKGLANKIRRITSFIEQRHHHRFHLPQSLPMSFLSSAGETMEMELINVSVDGCQAISPIRDALNIYGSGTVSFAYNVENYTVPARVIRLEAVGNVQQVRIAFEFSDLKPATADGLAQLLDELNQYDEDVA